MQFFLHSLSTVFVYSHSATRTATVQSLFSSLEVLLLHILFLSQSMREQCSAISFTTSIVVVERHCRHCVHLLFRDCHVLLHEGVKLHMQIQVPKATRKYFWYHDVRWHRWLANLIVIEIVWVLVIGVSDWANRRRCHRTSWSQNCLQVASEFWIYTWNLFFNCTEVEDKSLLNTSLVQHCDPPLPYRNLARLFQLRGDLFFVTCLLAWLGHGVRTLDVNKSQHTPMLYMVCVRWLAFQSLRRFDDS